MRRRARATLLVATLGAFGAGACARVLGANFDGLSLATDASSSSGGSAGNGASTGGTAGHTGVAGTSTSGGSGGKASSGGTGNSGGSDATGGTGATGGTATGGTGASGGSATGGTGATGGSATGGSGGGGVVNGVVLNEARNTSGDYVELYNTDGVDFDLSGYGLVDDHGISATERFPAGTIIGPHEYVLVLCNMALPISSGPTTNCSGLPTPCYFATFGVSQGGETVYLVTPQSTVKESTPVPGNLSASTSWGRLPNGTGAFTYTRATPKTVNLAP